MCTTTGNGRVEEARVLGGDRRPARQLGQPERAGDDRHEAQRDEPGGRQPLGASTPMGLLRSLRVADGG